MVEIERESGVATPATVVPPPSPAASEPEWTRAGAAAPRAPSPSESPRHRPVVIEEQLSE
jgi:hypothetical protein